MHGMARTASTTAVAGRVAGAVFAAIRRDLGYTREQFAEHIDVSAATVESWERGSRPLVNAPHLRLDQLRRRLVALGGNRDLMATWDAALRADGVFAEFDVADPAEHPLGLLVPDRTLTELLAWPITGQAPRPLAEFDVRLDVGNGERAGLLDTLHQLSGNGKHDGQRGLMLRRQTHFLLASAPETRPDVAKHQHADFARADLHEWSPEWPLARSTAIASAVAGDLEPLRRFIDEGLASDSGVAANLLYWAYWVGELPDVWSTDSAMTSGDTGTWSGVKLLDTLLTGVVTAPYRDLCAHTLATLLRTHRHLATHPTHHSRITSTVRAALEQNHLDRRARSQLEQVGYTMEVLHP